VWSPVDRIVKEACRMGFIGDGEGGILQKLPIYKGRIYFPVKEKITGKKEAGQSPHRQRFQ